MGCSHLTRKPALPLLVAAVGLLTAVAVGQQVKKTRTATISAEKLELDWVTNVWEFTENCKVTIGDGYNAEMSARAMTVKLSPKADRVLSLVAAGPVDFTVITAPDSQGVKRKITASAQKEATYAEDTQTVRLSGGAVADIRALDAAASVEAAHITGNTITANLKTNRLTVDKPDVTVKTELE